MLLLCPKITSLSALTTESLQCFPLSDAAYTVELFDSISAISYQWEQAAPADNIFLQRSYLELLERTPPKGFQFRYLLFYQHGQPVGVSILQHFCFKSEDNIELDSSKNKWVNKLKRLALKLGQFNVLICGNTALTGEHGFFFQESVHENLQFQLLEEAVQIAKQQLLKDGISTNIVLFKEYTSKQQPIARANLHAVYNQITFEPTMQLPIRDYWTNFEDYLGSMTSKYRVRAKRAFKKAANIQKRSLSLREIELYQDEIHRLYQNIADNAALNVIEWESSYFVELKQTFNEDFQLIGFFEEEQLIGFCTTLKNYNELEAHFLGFDHTPNRKYQLYLNMLYHMVDIGIQSKVHNISFARTAPEIKSSIGAEPQDLYLYMRHCNPIFNAILQRMFRFFEPKITWEQRKPFKEVAVVA